MLAALLVGPAVAAPVLAAEPNLPDWDQLTVEQQQQLTAPIRARWNAQPEERARMLDHAKRWDTLTPPQRKHARHGMERWQHMSPEQRDEARALYSKMRSLDPDGRNVLREQWRAMTPEQRKTWVDANPAPARNKDRPGEGGKSGD
ncbi:MAG: DUF3106 domain-containing protein [Lysobacter sp.]